MFYLFYKLFYYDIVASVQQGCNWYFCQIWVLAVLKMYRDIFNYEFNVGFHVPKKDMCDLCERFRMASDTEKAAMQATYNLHQHNKNLS